MSRKPNWPALLTRFLESKRDVPFDWATNNCGLFAADWCVILTGIDPMSDLRETVQSKQGFESIEDRYDGIVNLVAARCAEHGWPEVPPKKAQRGDLVVYHGEYGDTIGVCCGPTIAAPGKSGVVQTPMKQAYAAWRVC